MTAQAFIAGQRVTFLPMRLVKAANDSGAIDHTARNNSDRFHHYFPSRVSPPLPAGGVGAAAITPAVAPTVRSPFHEAHNG